MFEIRNAKNCHLEERLLVNEMVVLDVELERGLQRPALAQQASDDGRGHGQPPGQSSRSRAL